MNAETKVSTACVADRQATGSRLHARDKRAALYALSLALDCLCILAGYSLARTTPEGQWLDALGHSLLVIIIPIFLMLAIAREVQSVEALESRTIAIRRSLGALAGTAFAIIALTFLLQDQDISRLAFMITFASSAGLIVLNKMALDKLSRFWLGPSATASLLLRDGVQTAAIAQMDEVDVRALGLRPDLSRPAAMDALSHIIAPYDRVVVACTFEDRSSWATFLKGHDVGGEILLDRDILQGAVAIGGLDGQDTLIMSRGPLSLTNRIQKRAFDLFFGALAALFLGPLMLLVAIAIKLDSPGPVFFRQVRVGQGNRHFEILKFRSMRVDSTDHDGSRSAERDDPRVTRVGQLIRRTSIDELPQLFNVLSGSMSIVGPRPHALGSLAGNELFWEASPHYWIRHASKPGITGLAQIRGFRGATDTPEDLQRRVRADLEYLANWSLANDFLIMMRTLRVLVHKNAY